MSEKIDKQQIKNLRAQLNLSEKVLKHLQNNKPKSAIEMFGMWTSAQREINQYFNDRKLL